MINDDDGGDDSSDGGCGGDDVINVDDDGGSDDAGRTQVALLGGAARLNRRLCTPPYTPQRAPRAAGAARMRGSMRVRDCAPAPPSRHRIL